jgi:hypothetical protein
MLGYRRHIFQIHPLNQHLGKDTGGSPPAFLQSKLRPNSVKVSELRCGAHRRQQGGDIGAASGLNSELSRSKRFHPLIARTAICLPTVLIIVRATGLPMSSSGTSQ